MKSCLTNVFGNKEYEIRLSELDTLKKWLDDK